MRLCPARALSAALLVILLLGAACQANSSLPVATAPPTSVPRTPTPARNDPEPEQVVTNTPTVAVTATLPAHLSIDLRNLSGTQITFWHPWNGQLADRAEGLVESFNLDNAWGIRVRAQSYYSPGALQDALADAIDQPVGALPDVVAATSLQLAVLMEGEGLLEDLSGYIGHPNVGIDSEAVAAFHPVFWQQGLVDGRQVGIPAVRDARVLFYNQSWAKELGFPSPPTTPEELKQQACAAAVENNGSRYLEYFGTGGWLVDTDALTTLSWLKAFGAEVVPVQPGTPYLFESESTTEAFSFLHQLQKNGCAWLARTRTPQEYFVERKALFYTGSLQEVLTQKQVNELAGSTDTWTVLPFPGKDNRPVLFSDGQSLAVLKARGDANPRQAMAAWLFIRWLAQPENLVILAEAQPSLPVSSLVEQALGSSPGFPWAMLLPLRDAVHAPPALPSWLTVQRLVEDASWQLFHLPDDQVELVISQLADTSEELIERTP